MKKRSCPVCESSKAETLVRFTPEQLCRVNPSYKEEQLHKAVSGYEELITYSKCCNCGMVFCENLWGQDILRDIYDHTIDHEVSFQKISNIAKRIGIIRMWCSMLRVMHILGEKKLNNIKVIDYGCGWGDLMGVMKGYGVEVVGYDEDKTKTAFALKSGHTVVDDLSSLSEFGPVNIFMMNSVLEHIQDVDTIFKIIREVLAPNGFLVFSVMDYRTSYINKNVKRVRNLMPAYTKNLNPLEHVNIYDYKSVRKTLERFDFEFLSTKLSLEFSGVIPFFRKNIYALQIINSFEYMLSKMLAGQERGITVYARKRN